MPVKHGVALELFRLAKIKRIYRVGKKNLLTETYERMEEKINALSEAGYRKYVLRPAFLELRHCFSELLIAFRRSVALKTFVQRALDPLSYHAEGFKAVLGRVPDVEVNHLLALRLLALRLHHYVSYGVAYDIHPFCGSVWQLAFQNLKWCHVNHPLQSLL